LMSKVEFDRAFPHDRNEDGAHGVFSREVRRSLRVPVEKSFEITCQAFLVSVASSAPSGVSITKSQ
jgi:hypothetical protein